MTRSPQSTPLEAPTSPTRRGFLNGMTALGVAQVTAGTAGLVSLVACGGGGSEVVAPAVNRAPVANNFSLPMNIGSQPRSVNWKNLSFVSDPDGNTLVATVSHNGTSGNFSVVGDMLTYTPNSNTTALTDSGRLGIADGKGGSTEISVGVNGVDTMGASLVSEVFANISGGPAIPGTNFGSTFDTTLMLNEPVTSVQWSISLIGIPNVPYTDITFSIVSIGWVNAVLRVDTSNVSNLRQINGRYQVSYQVTDIHGNTSQITGGTIRIF